MQVVLSAYMNCHFTHKVSTNLTIHLLYNITDKNTSSLLLIFLQGNAINDFEWYERMDITDKQLIKCSC